MNQTKVYEFAKEVGIETLTLMDKIREWKLPIKSHMATLDEEQKTEIRNRLSAETTPKDKPKKTATKRAPAKAKSAKAETEKAAAPAAPRKRVVKKEADEAPPTAKSSSVIRRKAGAAEKAELETSAAENVEFHDQDANTEFIAEGSASHPDVPATIETRQAPSSLPPSNDGARDVVTGAVGSGTPSANPVEPTRPIRRGNIIGRMDLKRVTPAGGNTGGYSNPNPANSAAATQQGGPARPLRTTQRNIRTGFYAAPSVTPVEEESADKLKKRLGPRENAEVKHFSATEFRKREVIFQPKKKKLSVGRDVRKTEITVPKAHKRVAKVFGTIKVGELAAQMGIKATELVKKLITNGVMANVNSVLDYDTVALIVPEFGWESQNLERSDQEMIDEVAFGDLQAQPVRRPPVVTVMGHVDHGKTTLLDAIRKANVAAGEAGGITQHIGAYSVQVGDQKVTFLDTPGHEAFTAMRARGAHLTDIVIIVVAADDGVMPQTAEAINHAKAAEVPIIIAVNKVDRPNANVDRIKQQLTEYEIVPEEWGGSQIFVEVSALQKKGIDTLLEQILLQAEVLELKANPKRSGTGLVIESRMEKGRGPVATLLVQDGTLSVGQAVVAGVVPGRVRSLRNDRGETVDHVEPGMPVEIMGLDEVPQAGDRFDVCKDDESARALAADRRQKAVDSQVVTPASKMSLEQIFAKVKSGDVRELSVVLKADVAGSLEAIKSMVEKAGNSEVKVKLIHNAVGGITESDILLASAAGGLVLGFNVRPDGGSQRLAKEKGIEIRTYSIIYEMQDDLKKALSGLLAPEYKENVLGRAEVRNTFVVPKAGTIAGSFVVDGKVQRSAQARLVRDGKIIYEGKISSLRRFKDDAREVAQGFECGIGIENFNDIKVGDVIEAFTKEQVLREL